ncbi:Octanoate-[acyl-carrier-protein]-protein-N-octanoyltransferase [Acidisarcina polymorpha]|uniref:Octanoyltransferase n=1 Tax=Acidisarcina polymorpha TaxID=2211140 RepID=A0A2Z5G2Y1_9BACT|nr:lipoyl(octanoyl) transferase LipB [Acidisarcina polymorpha]AXC13573.1 Octanoate-[acyl-carrier-protein]-protein-N-octanoyltransferase [Acidisarcina polymorpha]
MILNLLQLGRITYAEALTLQRQLVELRHQQRIDNTLLLLEHPPVLTLGRNSQRQNILADDELLGRRGVEVHEINRGGDVTYHGPGQLVGYPILDLRSFTPRLGVVEYVRMLEEVLIRTCAGYGIVTQRIPKRTGVWTLPRGSISEKKIAAIGVHISRGITSHGFALNVTTDLRDFDLIVPCGIADRPVTSLENEIDTRTRQSPNLEDSGNTAARHFGIVFGTQVLRRASLEDLLSDAKQPTGETPQLVPEDTPLSIPKELKRLRGQEETVLA